MTTEIIIIVISKFIVERNVFLYEKSVRMAPFVGQVVLMALLTLKNPKDIK